MEERWLPVPGYEGEYEVSDLGRVRSLERMIVRIHKGKPLKQRINAKILRPGRMPAGHQSVSLRRHNSLCVHALVLTTFVGLAPAGYEARHLNGNPADNRLVNLEWATRSRNTQDKKWHKGARTYKLRPADVLDIRRRVAEGKQTRRAIAADYGCGPTVVYDILHGRSHRDVV